MVIVAAALGAAVGELTRRHLLILGYGAMMNGPGRNRVDGSGCRPHQAQRSLS